MLVLVGVFLHISARTRAQYIHIYKILLGIKNSGKSYYQYPAITVLGRANLRYYPLFTTMLETLPNSTVDW